MRLRIAFHNQCRTYMSVGYVDEGDNLVFARDTSEASDHMGRTTLRFVDLFASNPVAIDDKFTTGWGNTSMKESWSRSATPDRRGLIETKYPTFEHACRVLED